MSISPSDLQFIQLHLHHLWAAVMRGRQQVCALEAAAALSALGAAARLPIKFRAQYGEDAALWDIFEGATTGFFIEAGAFDGVQCSVTYALEAVGWTGLLVEPIPARAGECRVNRPHSRVVHAALGRSNAGGSVQFRVVADTVGTEGMLSSVASVPGAPGTLIDVPFTSLGALLEGHKGEIDAAVLDVEGFEAEVLDGLNLGLHRPKVLVVEDNAFGQDAGPARLIESAGYALMGRLNVSRFYVRTDLPALMKRAKAVFSFD